jgi:hypothetical protein
MLPQMHLLWQVVARSGALAPRRPLSAVLPRSIEHKASAHIRLFLSFVIDPWMDNKHQLHKVEKIKS